MTPLDPSILRSELVPLLKRGLRGLKDRGSIKEDTLVATDGLEQNW